MNALFHQEALVEALAAAFPDGPRLSRGTRGRTLKLQRNAGLCVPRRAAPSARARVVALRTHDR